ncbi:MAG TPA: hypothetical protein VNH44_04390 [Micropepsaceae bacterium]|nr:hypothetical protein [Micropepsaceae bacterium]
MAAIVGLVLAACAGAPADQDSPAYEAGFADGCATASAESTSVPSTPQRDETLYAQDSGYRSGWNSGHTTCRMTNGGARL